MKLLDGDTRVAAVPGITTEAPPTILTGLLREVYNACGSVLDRVNNRGNCNL